MGEGQEIDCPSAVRVAPTVLIEVAQEAAKAVPGVARLASPSQEGMNRLLGRLRMQEGVRLRTDGQGVSLSVHVVATASASLPMLAKQVQCDVARSVQELAGAQLQRLDVVIEDVDTDLSFP